MEKKFSTALSQGAEVRVKWKAQRGWRDSQPGLPIKSGRCPTMTHDYKRHGTTALFAAIGVLDATVIGR
ncbi:MAG: hypothetical protein JOZ58_27065 [Acetobacteraceae bacterium]|nr:hypothetical protein [Acetobacteraceae bacterium]